MSQKTECCGLPGRTDRAFTVDMVLQSGVGRQGRLSKPYSEGLVRMWPQQLPVTSMEGLRDTAQRL